MNMSRKNFRKYAFAGAFLILLFGVLMCKLEVSMAGMEASRLALVEAIADQGVFHIEKTHFKTVDKVLRNNHLYSDKPPTLSWCAAQVSKVITLLTGKNFSNSYNFMIYMMNMIFGVGVNMLIFLWLFRYFCRTCRGDMRMKLMFALFCCCGTWLFSYMMIFSNHLPSALFATSVMITLDKYRRKHDIRAAAWSGFSAGVLFTLDFVAGAVFMAGSVLTVWLLSVKANRFKASLCCAAGGVIVILFSVCLNYAAYGTVLPLYLGSGGSFTPGVDCKNHLEYFTECLFTYRGLFSYQPLLLLLFPGVYFMRKKLRSFDCMLLLTVFGVIVIYCIITNEFGGSAYGLRYFITVIPILMYYSAKFVLESRSQLLYILSFFLGVAGIITAVVGAYEPMTVAFEGYRSPEYHFTRKIRSTFMSNLFAWSYESFPDSGFTGMLISRYGKADSYRYLKAQYIITKHIPALEKLVSDPRFDLTKPGR